MHILIIGAGRIGRSVAENLVNESNDITIVDQDADARTAVLRIELEQIERSDGGQAGGLFHGAAGEGP